MIAENSTSPLRVASPVGGAGADAVSPAGGARLQPVDPILDPDWDARVAAYPDYSFFHGRAWAKTLQSTYGFTPVYFVSTRACAPPAMLPLMEVDSWLTGRRGVGLPFTDFCGPLCSDASTVKRLIESALEFGKSRGWKSVEFRGGREHFGDAPASLTFYGHSLELEADQDRMFARLESSVRRAIRKAEKNGVTVSVSGGLDAVKTFCMLQCRTRKKHGLPPQPFSFFQNIFTHILSKDLGMIVTATHQERPVAAAVFFRLGDRAIYKYGASDEKFQHLRGTNLVMWEAIKQFAHSGARTLHLGRTSIGNHGLRRFKLAWGVREQRIAYVKYDLRRGAFVTDTDEATGWHNRLFRALPVGVSRLIGAALYRHWA